MGLRVLARRDASVRAVVTLAVAVQLVPLAAPLLLSSDAWTYWDYGRIAVVHGANPYRETPSDFPDDPAYEWTGEQWRDRTSVYGPGFMLAAEPIAAAAGESHNAAAWIYKSLAALAAVAMILLAAGAAARPALAAAFVGWNPVLAVHLAGGGHNDAWVGALVLAALASAGARRQWAGAAWVLGASIKWIPVVLFPLRALEARATGRRVGHLVFALTAGIVLALSAWRYGFAWLGAAGPLADNARQTTSYALPHRLSQLGVPQGAAIALFGGALSGGLRGARARGMARPCTRCARRRAAPRLCPVRHAVVPRVGRAARGCGGGRGRPWARARAHGVPPPADDSRLNTSTPSSSNTTRQPGSRRRRAIAAAYGAGAKRSR